MRARVANVFDALGDSRRRDLLEAIASRGSATATELAETQGVTRQAIAKQLATLAGAGLVRSRRAGRETRYEPTPAPLKDAVDWLTAVGAQWDERLAALEAQLARRRSS